MPQNENNQSRPFWLLISMSFILILSWIIVVLAPWIFWKFMDIILWFMLLITWISAIINTVKNQNVKYIRFLLILWVLITILWFLLIFSRSHFIWTLTIRLFAIWALIRWIILVSFSLTNKESQNFRWAILWLWVLLFILSIVIMLSDKSEARYWAWVCIGISTIFDGITLLFFALRVKNNPSLQQELLNQSDQNEIAQWNVVISETTVTVSVPSDQSPSVDQPSVSIPASQPISETQSADTQQTTIENQISNESQNTQS